jgi:dehydrodolichyl diphosphate syntase complex subunit NUS1
MASTGITHVQETAFRRGTIGGKQLSVKEREELLKPFLPPEPASSDEAKAQAARRRRSQQTKTRRQGPIKGFLYFAIYHLISLFFSIFFRFRRAYRLVRGKVVSLLKYHHRTPEFIAHDVKNLEKLPKHLSVIVEYQEDDGSQGNAGLEGLVNDVCELAAWAASAGIPFLSIYERTGKLEAPYILSTSLTQNRCA